MFKQHLDQLPHSKDGKDSKDVLWRRLLNVVLTGRQWIGKGINYLFMSPELEAVMKKSTAGLQRCIMFCIYLAITAFFVLTMSFIDTYAYPYGDGYQNALMAYRFFMLLDLVIVIGLVMLIRRGAVLFARMLSVLISNTFIMQYQFFVGTQTDMDLLFAIVIIVIPVAIFSRNEIKEIFFGWVLGFVAFSLSNFAPLTFIPLVSMDVTTLQEARAGTMGLSLVVGLLFSVLRVTSEIAVDKLDLKTRQSQRLLLNILPETIADELISRTNRSSNISHFHPNVSVLFSDLVGFTSYCDRVSAERIVNLLNIIFGAFDRLTIFLGAEKIKTIGDGYMAACGIPQPIHRHAERATLLGLLYIYYIENSPLCKENGIRLRTGTHSGRAVAGVIGHHKFVYDIWGDTVNTASRMESNSEPMRLTASAQVVGLVHEKFLCVPRGTLNVRGKGTMKTWFVERLSNDSNDKSLLGALVGYVFGSIDDYEQGRIRMPPVEEAPRLTEICIDELLEGFVPAKILKTKRGFQFIEEAEIAPTNTFIR